MALSFSVVINTYNRAQLLARALESLAYLRHPAFEVVVVNGPSTDGTAELLAQRAGAIRIGHCAEQNLSKSRNVGISMARGDIVCFMDDDAVPEPDWLCQLETGYADPQVAAVGGFIRDHTGVAFQSKVVVCDRFADAQVFGSVEEAGVGEQPLPDRYLSLTGTNSSFRRSALLEIGGFDEEYAYFLDETDVILRLVDAGYRVSYRPAAEIHHKYAESHLRTAAKIPKSIYLPVRSKVYFCVKHLRPGQPLDRVFAYILEYAHGLRRDKKWLLDQGLIDRAQYERLIEEIDRGLADGIHDAFGRTNGRSRWRPAPPSAAGAFEVFRTRRPARDRLRVCLLSQDYPPGPCGGIGVWTHTLATALAKDGHELTVVTRGAGQPTVDFEEGVWVHRIVPVHHPGRRVPPLADLPQGIKDYAYTAYDEVLRIHARRGLDVVSSPIWDLEGAACIASRLLPTVLSLHSTYQLVLPSKPEWQADQAFKRLHVDKVIAGELWALEHADLVMANSRAIVVDIEAGYGASLDRAKVVVVPHGLPDIPIEEPGTDARALRLLFVGRFELRKGTDVLLDVLPGLLTEFPNLEAVLVGQNDLPIPGGPPLRDRFLAQHAGQEFLGRITFTGVLSDADLVREYARCDVFVAPGRYESFGLIYLEAMRCGKACIGSKAGGVPEIIEDGADGVLVPPGDRTALAEKIRFLLTDGAARRRIGAAARVKFEEFFCAEKMAAQAAAAYRALRAAHGAGSRPAFTEGRPRFPPASTWGTIGS